MARLGIRHLADVGIAMGTGSEVAVQSAGVTLVKGDLAGKRFVDEVFIRIRDQDGNVLDILVQSQRNATAAKRFFRKRLKGLQYARRVNVTDKLRSYAAAT